MPQPGTHERRETTLRSLLVLDEGNSSLRRDAIAEAFDAGDWTAARDLIDEGLRRLPDDASLLALSGFEHLQSRRYADAERALSAAISNGLEAPEPRYNLAFARFAQGRHEEALAILDERVYGTVPLAILLRARCLHHLQRHDEAIAASSSYLQVEPDRADAHGILALLLQETGRSREAQPHIAVALGRDPHQLEAMLALASIQQDAQELAAARASFGKLVEIYPGCGRGWLGLGLVELADLRVDIAKKRIERAVECMPRHIGTLHVLAWICLMQGDVDGAERAFVKAMALNRTFGETHGGLAAISALRGRGDEAREGIRRALRLDPRCMAARFAELVLLQRAGKHDEARAVIERFLQQRAPGRDVLFRDLVATHLHYIQARESAESARPTVH
jgi:tetratricopeptide (TPR) repeat protein